MSSSNPSSGQGQGQRLPAGAGDSPSPGQQPDDADEPGQGGDDDRTQREEQDPVGRPALPGKAGEDGDKRQGASDKRDDDDAEDMDGEGDTLPSTDVSTDERR